MIDFNIDDLLTEISFLTDDGIVNLTNPKHIILLKKVLVELHKYPDDFIDEFVTTVSKNAIQLNEESRASKQAKQRGLEYSGFGYWADKNGTPVAKSVNDKLVPLPSKERDTAATKTAQPTVSTTDASQKDVKTSIAPEPKNPAVNIFASTDVAFSDIKSVITSIKSMAGHINSIKYAPQEQKDSLLKILDGIRNGDFSLVEKNKKILNQFIRVGGNVKDPKVYIAVKELNNFNQGKRAKVENVGKKFINALMKHGVQTAETSTLVGGQVSMIKSHTLAGTQIFNQPDEINSIPVTKTNTSLTIEGYTVHKLKEPPFRELVDIYQKQNSKDAHRDAQFAMRAIRKHNKLLQELSTRLTDSIKVITPLSNESPTTDSGREKIANATLDKLSSKIASIFSKNPSLGIKEIISDLKILQSSKDFEKDSLTVLTKISNSNDIKRGAADIAEMFTYIRRLKSGQIAYMPVAANFPLADIISMSPLTLTDKSSADDIVNAIQSVFVSFDYRSIKKGDGAASAISSKIDLSVFKSKETRKNLIALSNTFDSIWNENKVGEVAKIAFQVAKQYKIDTKLILNDIPTKTTIDSIANRLSTYNYVNPTKLKKQLVVHNLCGKLIERIYNDDVDIQLFSNERYKENKKQMELSITDGIHSISNLKFVLDIGKFNIKSGKPESKYATRFYKRDL